MQRRHRGGFTIVEFLVLIGILMILVSIFLPYMLRIRETSARLRCSNNLKQLGDALQTYALVNNHIYPRVVHDTSNSPGSYTAFTGADDANAFAPGSQVKSNDVTASLWLLVRLKLVDQSVFICPSSGDSADLMTDSGGRFVKPTQRSNFRRANNLSYSYSSPFSSAPSYRIDDTRKAGFALMADKSPGVGSDFPNGHGSSGDSITSPAWDAPVLARSAANSRNHGKAGQNVLYSQGYVMFERTAYCGVGRTEQSWSKGDNIYTALARAPVTDDKSPAWENGYWANDIGPAWEGDSYLVPTADEGPDVPPVISRPSSQPTTPITTTTTTTVASNPATTNAATAPIVVPLPPVVSPATTQAVSPVTQPTRTPTITNAPAAH